MKKLQLLLICIIIIVAPAFSQESADMWIQLYDRLDTLEYKYNILQNIVDSDDRALIPLLQKVLDETNRTTLSTVTTTDRRYFDEMQRIAIRKLGEFRVIESEDAIFQAFRNNTNLVVRTDAIMALGNMESDKFIDDFIITLRNINMRAESNFSVSENEAMAFALVNYFENIRDIRSYEVLFYAASGWYGPRSGIRENARNILQLITEDPSEILKNIIENDPSFENKILALSIANDSSISDERKSNLAVSGLREGIRHITHTTAEIMQLSTLRLLASNMLLNSPHKDPEAIPYLERILLDNYSTSEKLAVIETLATYRSNEAVETLLKFLRDQNTKQTAGMSPHIDRRTVIATINALGEIGNPAARGELIVVTTIPSWATAVVQAAQAALARL
ncbi:MAG: HEAT repeat domain-containing protein [Spirochaetaceae bacterium]|nr:HEAT repeat domain-containing protein [Spirochaetaceae bacterium]